MSQEILILGGGGHAKVLIEALRASGQPVLGIISHDPVGDRVLGVPILGDEAILASYRPSDVFLVNGIGSLKPDSLRRECFKYCKGLGYTFKPVIHPSAVVAPDVLLGEGVQVMAGVVIQPGCRLDDNCIINTRATIDHDCSVGQHTHIAPGVTLSGGVHIGMNTHVGTGASIVQNTSIGRSVMIAAGAVVIRDCPDQTTIMGVPGKEL